MIREKKPDDPRRRVLLPRQQFANRKWPRRIGIRCPPATEIDKIHTPLPIDQWSSAVEFPRKYLSTLISLLNLGKCRETASWAR